MLFSISDFTLDQTLVKLCFFIIHMKSKPHYHNVNVCGYTTLWKRDQANNTELYFWLHTGLSYSPLMPLPSSWKELRCRPEPPPKPASSRCSLPPLPEEAMLLWGERGAWSGAGPLAVRKSSWDSQMWPRGWLLGPLMGGVKDTERFRGLCCWLQLPLVRTARTQQD